ncbi:YxlC family protein [Bacillus sp. JJ664]
MSKETDELLSAMKQIDELTEVEIPSLNNITQKITLHQHRKRSSYVKELILFICVACSLFVGAILLSLQTPMNLIVIQLLGFIAIPLIFIRDKKKIESEW